MSKNAVYASLSSAMRATYIEIVEFCFRLKEKLINEQFRIHVKQSSLHTKGTQKATRKTKTTQKHQRKAIINFLSTRKEKPTILYYL